MSDSEKVTYLEEVIANIQAKLREAGTACTKKVLPGARPKVMKPLQEAHTLLKGVDQAIKESGMGKKLGFVPTKDGIQPVVQEDEESCK